MTRFQHGVPTAAARAGAYFGLLCLDAAPGAGHDEVDAGVRSLLGLGERLRRGDLWPYAPEVDPEGLTLLVGYGPGGLAEVPGELAAARFAAPGGPGPGGPTLGGPGPGGPGPGGPILAGTALRWAPAVGANPADCAVAVQLTARSQAAVSRAAVEIQRLLYADGALAVTAFFTGYRRTDQRSWIGFHDGVANPDPTERADAMRVPPGVGPAWLVGGTYLAFLRVRVRLEEWDALDPAKQELLIGRDKHTGAPLVPDPRHPGGYCPMVLPAPGDVLAAGNLAARDPLPVSPGSALGRSHVQRARRMLAGRIVRQGYEYLEPVGAVLHTGLNFVSYQSTPQHLTRILTLPTWFGEGGGLTDLLEVYAAGIYAVPPLPGSS
jgi:deferrochelatase/peroxidase EfeB